MFGLEKIRFEDADGRQVAVLALDLAGRAPCVRVPADPAQRDLWISHVSGASSARTGFGGLWGEPPRSLAAAMAVFRALEERDPWRPTGGMVLRGECPVGIVYVCLRGTTGEPWRDDPLRLVFGECALQGGQRAICAWVRTRRDWKAGRPARRVYLAAHKIRPDQPELLALRRLMDLSSSRPLPSI